MFTHYDVNSPPLNTVIGILVKMHSVLYVLAIVNIYTTSKFSRVYHAGGDSYINDVRVLQITHAHIKLVTY